MSPLANMEDIAGTSLYAYLGPIIYAGTDMSSHLVKTILSTVMHQSPAHIQP